MEEEKELHFFIDGPLQFNTQFGVVNREKYFDGLYFNLNLFMMYFEFKPIAGITLGSFLRIGDSIDFANSQLGDEKLFEPFIDVQLGKHFSARLNSTNQTMNVDGGQLFTAELYDLRFAYQFNGRSRLSLTVQSTNIGRTTELYSDNYDADPDNDLFAKDKNIGTQLIYSYKINPQTLLYIGYSDSALESDDVQSLKKTDKSIFAKFSYLWQI